MPHIIKIKFSQEEINQILLKHLVIEGQIGECEAKFCKGRTKVGKSDMLEFEFPAGDEFIKTKKEN